MRKSQPDTFSPENKPNRLIIEKSPYLLQHAYNPVDWHPWGQEAFDRAKQEDRPIFLSIGYSTCHWCHVMEKESFENRQVAAMMNEAFVSVKVDREERPDIDTTYMTVCQLMTGSGGWPLTIIMTPDKIPFFAGTYFPKESRFGRVGMLDLIPHVQKMWKTDKARILKLSTEVTDLLAREDTDASPEDPELAVLHNAFGQLIQLFDEANGGFSSAPKFPTAHMLLFLLRYWSRTNSREALHMVTKTLDAMRDGGIYDHVGFGFHRYSTDAHWLVPHFEKMLYDQAMLCMAYTEAYQATGNRPYRKTAEEILTYVLRDMTSPEGGFFSAEDADSEGEEGKFYVWSPDEIVRALGHHDAELICSIFTVLQEGNFTDQISGERSGINILHKKKPLHEIAAEKGLPVQEVEDRINRALVRLFYVRNDRIHPHKDDKVLTDWNGLMIAALAKAARAFQAGDYADAAAKAVSFILNRLRKPDGRLLHRYREDEAALPAHIDDYAFLISGLIELYEATFDPQYLREALSLNAVLLSHYWDNNTGGFYFTSDDSEDLLVRKKESYDGAIPSGNSVALHNLLRLGRMTGDTGLEEMAARAARAFYPSIRQSPAAYAHFLSALDFSFGPTFEVVIAGDSRAGDTNALLRAVQTTFLPRVSVLLRPTEDDKPDIVTVAGFTRDHAAIENRATAYVCRRYHCLAPTTDRDVMLAALRHDT